MYGLCAALVWVILSATAAAQSVAPRAAPAEGDEREADDEEPEPVNVVDAATASAPAPTWQASCRMEENAWSGAAVPATPVYVSAPDGACFCSVLTARATHASRRQNFFAWTLATAAASLVIVGPVLGNEPRGNLWERERGTLLAVSGLAIAPLAYYLFKRADRAGTVAARASEAQGQAEPADDFALYRACAAAKADWVASREASAAFAALSVARLERAAKEAKEAASEAAEHAEESRQNAEAANKAAEQAQQSADQAESMRDQ